MFRILLFHLAAFTTVFSQILWQEEVPGSMVKDLALNESGSLFIAGMVENSVAEESWEDFYTVKISAVGDSLWAHAIHSGTEHANAITMDNEGNVISAGSIDKEGGWWEYDYLVSKYSKEGNMEWQSEYGGTSGRQDKVIDIITDDEGNIFVTGETHNHRNEEANMDITTIKLNHSGDTLWTRTYNSPYGLKDSPNHIHMDDARNIFVTGDVIYDDTPNDQFAPVLLKYDTEGNLLFDSVYTNISRSVRLEDSQMGADGSIYLHLNERLSVYIEEPYRGVRKYDIDGRFAGDMRYKADTTEWDFQDGYVDVDDNGNVFMLTHLNKGEWWENNWHVTLACFDVAGNLKWSHEYPVNDEWDRPYGIEVDADGNCYILHLGTADDQYFKEANLKKIDGNGRLRFSISSGTVDHNRGSSHIGAMRMTIDDQGHAWVVYRFADEDDLGFFRIIKYDTRVKTALFETEPITTPQNFELSQNYPNPFNPFTAIRYFLPAETPVTLAVYDLSGKLIDVLQEGPKSGGAHRLVFDASRLASGNYIYRLTTRFGSISNRMTVVK